MHQLHILSVGISLLTNYSKAANLPLSRVLRCHRQVKAFLEENPCAACAEINSLNSRTGFLGRPRPGLGVSLIYASTAGQEGRLAARLIGNFLRLRGMTVTEIRLRDIGVPAAAPADAAEAARLAEAGLIRLYDKIEKHVIRLRRQDPNLNIAINATGGYKAEIAILYNLGCKLGIPVYYLHETYRVCIQIPVCSPSS